MSTNPSSDRPSWRGPDAAKDEGRALGPRWRQGSSLTPVRSGWPWGRIALAFLAFAAMCALFVWVSLWLRPAKDTSLVLIGADYQQNLAVPHNVYDYHTLDAL